MRGLTEGRPHGNPPDHHRRDVASEHYEALAVCGAGDKKAEMRYSLKRI
jgi:hypothetical protein